MRVFPIKSKQKIVFTLLSVQNYKHKHLIPLLLSRQRLWRNGVVSFSVLASSSDIFSMFSFIDLLKTLLVTLAPI